MTKKVKVTGTIYRNEEPDYPVSLTIDVDVSLRDLFAAFALAGMNAESAAVSGEAIQMRAQRAYEFADATIAAREGKP